MNTPTIFVKALIIFFILVSTGFTQNFIKITDASNPIVSTGSPSGSYMGASWIDFNGDGRLDLFWNRGSDIFVGHPGNIFSILSNVITNQGNSFGNTWADYDNDGDIDCFISGAFNSGSFLYRNDGSMFTKILTGDIGDSINNKAWGCAWGDYDNDGFVDLILAAAFNFAGISNPNRLFNNNGDGTFTLVDTSVITDTTAPFTVPTWYDYDLDGDIDLFIGSGPANGSGARDYLYHNFLKETGTAYFERIDTGALGTDIVDGQVWNWVDYDTDGDLDGFVTNYSNAIRNNLYRNEGNYYFRRMDTNEVGSIVDDPGLFLSNIWVDFDNDGDEDCLVTRDGGQRCYYYNNKGNGTFARVDTTQISVMSGGNYGATAGDFDKDGDMDVFIIGSTSAKGLFMNTNSNGNSRVNITCEGIGPSSGSNVSAIGTIVRTKANINGSPVWQIRQVSAQNSFNSQNSLSIHFGFGNATIIDSLEIRWPSGIVDVYTGVTINSFYNAIEGLSLDPVGVESISNIIPDNFELYQNYPNPFNPSTNIKFDVKQRGLVTIKVYDMLGKEVTTLVNEVLEPGSKVVTWEGHDDNGVSVSSGVYFYKMVSGNYISSRKMVLVK